MKHNIKGHNLLQRIWRNMNKSFVKKVEETPWGNHPRYIYLTIYIKNKKRQLRVFHKENGELSVIIFFHENNKETKRINIFKGETIRVEQTLENDFSDAVYYNDDGTKDRYLRNKQHHTVLHESWYPSGQLKHQEHFKDRKVSVSKKEWYSNGQQKELIDSTEKKTWYPDGVLESHTIYKKDSKLIKQYKKYHENEHVHENITYQGNGVPNTKQVFDKNGICLIEIQYHRNGNIRSQKERYSDKQKKSILRKNQSGIIVEDLKWHPNGKLEYHKIFQKRTLLREEGFFKDGTMSFLKIHKRT